MASQFNWLFTYPDGDSSAELHLVLNRPTKLIMQSKDVLHSLYIPAFRQKMDIVPGRYTYTYLQPNMEGQYRLACTEYCGEGHSQMRTMAQVHIDDASRKADTQWIRAKYPAWKNGQHIYNINCSGCHKVDGKAATGPALNDIWGKKEALHNGSVVDVNEQYVQDSIWFPEKDVVAGYGPVSKMNSFKGQLDEKDVNDVIAFLKYLKDPSLVSDTPIGELTEENQQDEPTKTEPASDDAPTDDEAPIDDETSKVD